MISVSGVFDDDFSDAELVRAFTVEGLANAHVSASKLKSARIADRPVTWKLGRMQGDPFSSKTDQLLAEYMPRANAEGDSVTADSLRLLAPVGRLKNDGVVGGIVGLPGYQAGANIGGDAAAFKSFTIDPTPAFGLPSYLGWRTSPVLSLPMPVHVSDDLNHSFDNSQVVQRGFLDLSPAADLKSPSLFADIVEFDGGGLTGSYLALRFLRSGIVAVPLQPKLSFAALDRSEPLVLLPLNGSTPEQMLTRFVYELTHNSPVDVAAWDAVRKYNFGGPMNPPIVLAPRAFLNRARLSDLIPGLQARLGRLAPDKVLDVSENDLLKFNREVFKDRDLSKPTAGFVRDFLENKDEFVWAHESDSAESMLAIIRSVEALESVKQRPSLLDQLGKIAGPVLTSTSTVLRGGFLNDFLGSSTIDGGVVAKSTGDVRGPDDVTPPARTEPPAGAEPPSGAEPPGGTPPTTAAPQPNQPRYTDITFTDGQKNRVTEDTPLVAGVQYTLDVAIRTRRIGITRSRFDQPQINIPRQTAPEYVWVVITDESDEIGEEEERPSVAFKLERHFSQLQLPVIGDSIGSASFGVTPLRSAFPAAGRRRIGVRIYHKLNLIDHLELELLVVPSRNAVVPPLERPALDVVFLGSNTGVEPLDEEAAERRLNISINQAGEGSYHFAFMMETSRADKPFLFGLRKLSADTLNGYAASFRNILLDAAFGRSAQSLDLSWKEREDILRPLALLGTTILRDLFDNSKPEGDFFEVGKILRSQFLPAAGIIQISLGPDAQEFIFPWQILTVESYTDKDTEVDPNNLWGYRFIIEIKRCGDAIRAAQAPNGPVRICYGRWKDFTNEQEHYDSIKKIVNSLPTKPEFGPIIDDKQALIAKLRTGGGNLVYLYAHGHAATPSSAAGVAWRASIGARLDEIKKRIADSKENPRPADESLRDMLDKWMKATAAGSDSLIKLSLTEVPLTSLTDFGIATGEEIRLRDSPIIVLNTCDSAQLWCAVKSSFVGFFLDRGARAVLGTEATMPILVAEPFGQVLLESMLSRRESLGKAVFDARLHLLQKHKNPLGLSYSVYGDATARVFEAPVPTA